MADRMAVMRAAQGGGAGAMGGGMGGPPGGGMTGMPPDGPPGPGGMPPEGGPGAGGPKPPQGQEGGFNVRAILDGFKAAGDLIQAEAQKGNPAAQKGAAQLKELVKTMSEMAGQGGDSGAPPSGAQQEAQGNPEEDPENPKMKIGPGTGPNPVRSFGRGTPAGTFKKAVVV